MKDFWFLNPTEIIFGRNKVDEIGNVVGRYGSKVLLVYGQKSIIETGLYERIRRRLKEANVMTYDFGGIKSNPVISHVREGIDRAKEVKADVVLGVGGGSVIDSAKVIAAGVKADCDVWNFFVDGKKPQKALPIITVVTISGTGSEMNGGAVITNEKTKQKLGIGATCIYPKVSILDPNLTISVPSHYTAYGIVDTFSHVSEPYFNSSELFVPVQDQLAEGLMKAIIEISGKLMKNLCDYNARADMMWASTVAFNRMLGAGRGPIRYEIHLLAHSLGALFDLPHGATLSVLIPAWLKYHIKDKEKSKKLLQFVSRIMNVEDSRKEEGTIYEGIRRLQDWFSRMGCPVSLKEIGLRVDDLEMVISNTIPIAKSTGFEDYNEGKVKEILLNTL